MADRGDGLRCCGQLVTQDIFIQVCEVVSYLHKMGVCHLDLKPDNILLSDSKVVLIDFNTASECQNDG